jgi:hypothetical protein
MPRELRALVVRAAVAVALLLALLFAAQLAGAPGASAKGGLITGLVDPVYRSSADQDAWLDLTGQAEAEMVRIGVSWRSTAPTPPADPRDPSDPAYRFSNLDASVRAAAARGFEVLLSVQGAPDWAEGPNRPSGAFAGSWDPDPGAFGDFGHALARRYSGGFPDPASAGSLPRVRHFEVWNEPNLPSFLGPQWNGKRPRSPEIYRGLLNSFYDGVKAADQGNVVVGGATSAYGDSPGGARMRPLLFLRELFCLEGRRKLKPKKSCPPVKLDVLSDHPINTSGGPRRSALHPDDAATADVGNVGRVLRAAEKGGNVQPGGRRPLWVTEFWWLSNPPGSPNERIAVPLGKHARWIEEALYLFWKNKVKAAFYFRVRDPVGTDVPSGLFFADGTPKPALTAFRFPFVTERRSRKRVQAWGKSPATGELVIERKKGGKWRREKSVSVSDGQVFATKLKLRKGGRLRAVVGEEQSLTWRQRG